MFDIFILSSKYFLDIKILEQFKYSKEIALFLKSKKIDKIYCNNKKICKKLYFYGLEKGDKYLLNYNKTTKKVSISHNNKTLYSFYVSKINKNN